MGRQHWLVPCLLTRNILLIVKCLLTSTADWNVMCSNIEYSFSSSYYPVNLESILTLVVGTEELIYMNYEQLL